MPEPQPPRPQHAPKLPDHRPHLIVTVEYYEDHMETRIEKGPGTGTTDPGLVALHYQQVGKYIQERGHHRLYNVGDSLTLKGGISNA